MSGIVDRQGLCRAAWAFQKLRISDDEVKASLEAKALEILHNPNLSNEHTLILDITTQLGKYGVINDKLLFVLANQVDQLFKTMEPPVDLSRNLKALKSLNSLGKGSLETEKAFLEAIQQRINVSNNLSCNRPAS